MSNVLKALFKIPSKGGTESKDKDVDLRISEPQDFKHNIKVSYDKEKNDFIGLPEDWRKLLDENKIKFVLY